MGETNESGGTSKKESVKTGQFIAKETVSANLPTGEPPATPQPKKKSS